MSVIPNQYNGILTLQSNEDVAFSANNGIITLIPTSDKRKTLFNYVETSNSVNDNGIWMFGTTANGENIAFLRKNRLSNRITTNGIGEAWFRPAITLVGPKYGRNALHTKPFVTIEFYGGIVDTLHPPSLAISDGIFENKPFFNSFDEYERSFDAVVNNEEIEIEFTVSIGIDQKVGKIPDLQSTIHSSFKMKFKSPQSFDDIIKYYRYGYNLFEFCSGRQNINTEVRLYEKNIDQHIVVDLNEQFDDYAQDDLDYTQVIRFLQLGGKITSLFKLLNEEKTKPNLLFLPDRNKLKYSIKYTDITDLCNSLDGEYIKNNIDSIQYDKEKAKKLRDELYYFIDAQQDYPPMFKDKAKNLLGPLKNFSPSLKEKIVLLVDIFFDASMEITQIPGHDLAGVTFYTRDTFNDMIGKFISIRNHGAHVGIAWNEGTDIFSHLKLYVYYSILKRAGYSLEESTNILRYFLSRFF